MWAGVPFAATRAPATAPATARAPPPASSVPRVVMWRLVCAGSVVSVSAGPCSRIRSSNSWSENLVILVTPDLIGGYRVPAQLGTGPHQPHPRRARRDPEHCRRLL